MIAARRVVFRTQNQNEPAPLPVESPTPPTPRQERRVSLSTVLAGLVIVSLLVAVAVGNLQREKEDLQSELAELQGEIADLNARFEGGSFSTSVAELGSRVTLLQSRLDSLESENSFLLSRNSELRTQVDSLQRQLDRLKSIHVSGVYFSGPPVYYNSTLVYVGTVACTGSMRPTLDCDDLLIQYVPRSATELQVGDIVVYHIPSQYTYCDFAGQYILHRIVRLGIQDGETYYVLKGDANATEDDCGVWFDYIESKVIGVIYDAN